ncbi:MAG: autotransporter domain-containing protein [Phenylobacterium sp.]|uniref:autotransporter domain-containing protein n=1 Tax=Phenylobacterium sp. TaxID=1871053 RepID=UPI00122994C8|nr:autotransporter domain-containing protein [Phenylobacterium sp.]TAJ69136.1 MAG: autotransporter domain-containing protein [Phenylobacterium sp.]
MSYRVRVRRPSRSGSGLLVSASYLALAAVALAPQAAWAADHPASDEASFKAAITAANADPAGSPSITLTGNVTIADSATIPALTKPLTLNLGAFQLNNGRFNSPGALSLTGSGQALLAGSNALGSDLNVTDSTLRLNSGVTLTAAGLTQFSGASTLWVSGAGSRLTAGQFRFGATAGTETVQIENGGVFHSTYTGTTVQGLGLIAGSQVNVTITGAGSLMDIDGQLGIGTAFPATASVNILNGGALTGGATMRIGSATQLQTVVAPSVLVSGVGSSLTAPSLVLSQGTLDVLAGGGVTASSLTVGGSNGTAALRVSGPGSSVTSTGAFTLGAAATSSATLTDGGVLNVGGLVTLGSAAGRTGVVSIGGAEAQAAAAAGSLSTATLAFGPGTGRLNFNHTGTNYAFSPVITGAGAINQVAGVTHLTGNSAAFTGTTTVSGGALHVDGTLGGATSSVAVNGGGVLGGSGTIGGNVAVSNGVLAPGNSPGTLTINGNLTLASASVLDFEFGLSNVVGGPMNDLVKVGGALTLDGTIDVSVTAGGVFDAGLYRVINYGGALTDNGLTVGATPPGSTVTVQTAIAGQVNLVNTAGLPVNFWDGDAGGNSGNSRVDGGAGTWTSASTNWTTETGTPNTTYTPDSLVIFAAAPGTVNVGAVAVDAMQFAVDGYRLTGGAITIAGGGNIFRVGDGTADGKDYVAIIDTPIVGSASAGLTKTDLGTLILNGANTYGFVTNVQAGTLLLNGSIVGGGSALVVGANGTFGGTGSSRGGAVSGTLAPGGLTNPGTLTFNSNLTLNSTATLRYRLGQAGTVGGGLNDLLVVNGNLTLDGTLNVTQSAGGIFGPGVYRLINYTGTLTDNGLDLGTLPGGFTNTIQTSIAGQVNLVAAAPPPGGGGPGGGDPPPPPPPPPTFNFWDGGGQGADGSISGGSGTWRAAGDQGWTDTAAAINGAYANGGFAIFAGQGGVVTVDNSQGAVSASGLQFAADGYRIGGGALTLTGPDATLRVGDGTTAGAAFTATVDAQLTGDARLVKTDAGTLVLTAANTYAGGTVIQGGVLVGGAASFGAGAIVDNAALILDQATDATFANAIEGAGTFMKRGAGRLTYTGAATLTGPTTVEAGVLAVDGSLGGSAVTVRKGATLSGSGAVGAAALDAGAAIAPGGDKLGVLTLNGSLSQAAGSVYRVQLDTAAGASDRLAVTGSATLAGGAVLDVSRVGSAPYSLGDVFTVLHAEGGVTGTYSLTGDLGPISAFLGLRDSYDARNVYLTVAQVRALEDAGATPNQVAAGGGADSLPASNPVRGTLVGLPTDASAQAAFDQISGEPNASAKAVMIAQSAAVREAALARLQDAACGLREGQARDVGCSDVSDRAAGWAQALGGWGKFDGDAGTAGVDHDSAGFLTGLDLPLGGWRIGGFAGYSRSNWDIDARRASGDSDDYHLGAYGGRAWDRLSLKLGGGYTRHEVSARRSVAVAAISERLDADYDAGALQAFGELGYRFGSGGMSLEPFANLAHVRLRTDGFAETGGATALTAEAETMRTTIATLGVRPTTAVDVGPARATLRGLLGWRHAFGDVVPASTHRFAGGAAFGVEGASLARDAAVLEAGADFAFGRGGTASVTYGGQFGDGVTDQRVRVDVRLTF